MKTIFLSAIAILAIGNSTYGQDIGFSKGSKLVEGSVHFSKTKGEEKNHLFNFTTNLGYFLTDKIAIGPTVNFINFQDKTDITPEGKILAAGLFGRHYFLEPGKRFKTYTEVKSLYERIHIDKYENSIQVSEPLFQAFNMSAGVGANYFITPKIAVNLSLSNILYFNIGKSKGENDYKETYFDLNVNQFYNEFASSNLGLTFKF